MGSTGLHGKTKSNSIRIGEVVHNVFALLPCNAKETEIDAAANVLQTTEAHLALIIKGDGNELRAGSEELLTGNDDGEATGLAVARDAVHLLVVVVL